MSAIPPTWLAGLLGTLILALLVALGTRWIRLPYTIALVIVGLVLGWLGNASKFGGEIGGGLMSAELILFILLPPLLFEGAAGMHIERLRKNWRPITLLAIPGVLINTLIIALISWRFVWWGDENGLLFGLLLGSILAATDPVSVLSLVRKLGAPKRLSVLIEGESLFNDGTAVVLFNIILVAVLTALAGGSLTPNEMVTSAVASFLSVVTIGLIVGLVLGVVANSLLHHSDDHMFEIALTVALAFGSFLLAELVHGSGVIAVVVAGLMVGNHGVPEGMTPTARIGLHHFWEIATFLINSVLFLMIGFELQSILHLSSTTFFLSIVGISAALLARTAVFPLTALSNLSKQQTIPSTWKVAMYWGGLRGSIPIALLLLLSHLVHEGTVLTGFSEKVFLPEEVFEAMLVMSFAVILWTLIVQGLTMRPLMNRLGISGVPSDSEIEYEVAIAESMASRAALSRLSQMRRSGLISREDEDSLAESLQFQKESANRRIESLSESSVVHAGRVETARRELLLAQIDAIHEVNRLGTLSPMVASQMLTRLHSALSESAHSREKIELVSFTETTDDDSVHELEFEGILPKSTEEVLGVELETLEEE